MTEMIRQLLESYPVIPKITVQTDLSAAKVPSYAVAQKEDKLLSEDISGNQQRRAGFSLNMRRAAGSEADRQRAYRFLNDMGAWLEGLEAAEKLPKPQGGRLVTGIETKPPQMQEAYDDGTAVWNMNIEIHCEGKGK